MDQTEIKTEATSVNEESKERGMYYFELLLILILGALLGIVAKTEASKRITIGFDDYKVASKAQSYNFSELEKELAKKKAEEPTSNTSVPSAGSCSQ